MIRRARLARKLRKVAHLRGYRISFKLAYRIVAAAQDANVPVSRLAGLVEKESAFQFVFGHDAGGLFPGEKVTRHKYDRLRAELRATGNGANGVGYVQVTWPGYILEDGSLWRPKHNLRWGARNLDPADLNAYNGDPTGGYGLDLRLRIGDYHQALSK